jgi:hypothetical protein
MTPVLYSVIPAQAGIQQKQFSRTADKATMWSCFAGISLSSGFPPDGATSHSTKLANNASLVAGYARE